MDTKNLEDSKGFISFREYTESQDKIKRDLLKSQESVKRDLTTRLEKAEVHQEKLDLKVEGIDGKVDGLKELVIPLSIALTQTAENTKQMAQSMEKFTESQTVTNGIFYDKIHGQAIMMEGFKSIAEGITEKKKYNLGVTVAGLGIISVIITGLFNLAPIIFPK